MSGPLRVAVDIGGTFTDVVAFDGADGSLRLAKALTTPAAPARGVDAGLGKIPVPLGDVATLIHGTTVVVNAIIERRGARTALVTTEGFRDVYEIGRINRPESFNPRFRKHRPLVPRAMVFEVPERVLADGSVRLPLDEAAARAVAERLHADGVEAVAVLFLHAYRAPEHEVRMCEILREADPALYVTASHALSREYREYERTSTTVANAYVGPLVSGYLDELQDRLGRGGFRGEPLAMLSNGGLADFATARRQAIQMMESGPAGGVVGTMAVCEALDIDSAVAFDMGGTTAKACVVRRGEPNLSPDYFIGGYNEGLAIRIPVLEIVEVGTGGGSVAWLDGAGGLHVGPRSAGADPGPACYGRGGSAPTVTDANVVLGRLSGEAFLGGEMRLDPARAERALREGVAGPLGVGVARAAAGMLEVATAAMANIVRQVTLQRGLDPRDFAMVAYGGGGPLHATAVARELSIGRVIVPPAPGHFSALGMLMADLRRDYVKTVFSRLDRTEVAELERAFQELEAAGTADLLRSGIPTRSIVCERAADMRYVGQEHTVSVGMPGRLGGRAELHRRFDRAHEQRYAHQAPDQPAEVVSLRVTAIGRLAKPQPARLAAGTAACRSPLTRSVHFGRGEPLRAAVFERARLLAGNVVDGPAVIEEAAATTLLWPGDVATVTELGHLDIRVGG